MSKKKSFSGSTMTLKDFHGGSIPSDLPLPSAPGVSVRPPDRQAAWGGAAAARGSENLYTNRHRQAPSSGAASAASAAAPFLPSNTNIGRHFDEDERKPFDATASAPRRPSSASPSSAASAPRSVAAAPVSNPWVIRKDLIPPEPMPTPTVYSGAITAASKLAHASAIDKVSSGRWHSKLQPDGEVIKHPEIDCLDRRSGDSVRISGNGDWGPKKQEAKEGNNSISFNMGGNRELEGVRSPGYLEAKERNMDGFDGARPISHDGRFGGTPVNQQDSVRISGDWGPKKQEAKKGDNSIGFNLGGNSEFERARSPGYLEAKERNFGGFYVDGARPMSHEGRSGGTQVNQQGIGELGERHKLKLLPRTKAIEASDSGALDEKPLPIQKSLQPVDSGHVLNAHDVPGSANPFKPVSAGSDGLSQATERPRLNLKPRSQPLEQSDENLERGRNSVFGGARPRELVLKERGIDVVAANNIDVKVSADRGKQDIPKTESKLVDSGPSPNRHVERVENFTHEPRSGRVLERKDHRPDPEKVDVQRNSWKNDSWRSTKDREKPPEQRRPEPETWRKPVEEPKPEGPITRFGKAASALELAQAFSKSVSDTSSDNHTGPKSLPGRAQLPFSRLTDNREFRSGPPKTQINGY